MSRARYRLRLRQALLDQWREARLGASKNRRVDPAGADAIDADTILAQFDRGRARQVYDRGLCSAVRVETRVAAQSGDRGRRDNRATAALAHLRNRVLHSQENAAQENRERAVPVLDGDLLQRTQCATEPGIVIDDVESAKLLDCTC